MINYAGTKFKYAIAGKGFKTKKEICAEARHHLGGMTRHELTGMARNFFLDLLKHHDEWKMKTAGTHDNDIHLVYENMFCVANKPSWGIRLYFGDERFRGDDISWTHASKMIPVPGRS